MRLLIFVIYDIALFIAVLFFLPLYALRKKINFEALLEKLTIVIPVKKIEESIWIQAVSVGEVISIRALVDNLQNYFSFRIVISTTTLTGKKVAKNIYGNKADIIFLPFDITFLVKRIIKRINPKIFIAIETEIWPNLFYQLYKKKIPIVILNGRISDKAYKRYKKIKFITEKILSLCSYIGVQNNFYLERFLSLGASSDRIAISGNIKFANIIVKQKKLLNFKDEYLSLLKHKSKFLFIAASTHSREEKAILEVYKSIKERFSCNLLIAPRHPERTKEVEKEVRRTGLIALRISQLREKEDILDKCVFILDTVGDLFYFYSIADVCFVGGSLFDYGGHNILEPLYFSKPTLFGPYMSNFKEIEEVVLEKKAAIKVQDKKQLRYYIERILFDDEFREVLCKNASKIFEHQRALVKKNIEIIKSLL